MAELTIREVEPELIEKLTQLAEQHRRTVEEEHKSILRSALIQAPSDSHASFAAYLLTMPDVGTDGDFARIEGQMRDVELGE